MKLILSFSLILASLSAQSFSVRMHADNEAYGYFGNPTNVTGPSFVSAKWPTIGVANTSYTGADTMFYVAASNDGASLQGFIADVRYGSSLQSRVLTGALTTPWQVCETGKGRLTAAPTPAALSLEIAKCNSTSGWKVPVPGVADANSTGLWGPRPDIDDNAGWTWYPRGCNGNDAFRATCKTKEYLIFRLPIREACPPPVPSFTIDMSSGWGVLNANGTASTAETSYFWSIQASDASWNRFGTEYTQWFTNQQAGPIDLKQFIESKGGKLECNKYYRVKLAVSNACIAWQDVTKLVKLNCCSGEVIEPAKP